MGRHARYATWLCLACSAAGLAAFGACAAPYAASGDDAGGAPDGAAGEDADAASDSSTRDATGDGCPSCSGSDLALNVAPTSRLIATETAIFWADPVAQAVYQTSELAGSTPTTLASALAVTGELVADNKSVYFTAVASPTTWTLWRAAVGLAGSAIAIGTYAGVPRGLAVDASFAYVFQSGVGANLTLAAAPLTGGPLEPILQVDPAERGLVFVGGNLFWTQPGSQWVVTVNAATRDAGAAVVAKSTQSGADLLTTAGSGLYWANLNATPASIAWGSASDTTVQSIADTPIAPVSLITDGTTAYWADGIDTIWSARTTLGAGPRKVAAGLSQPGPVALSANHVVILERGRGAIVLRPR
jgi:hypothetical protein